MIKPNCRVLVLGASGMLGNAVTRVFTEDSRFMVTGTVRSRNSIGLFPTHVQNNIVSGVTIDDFDTVRGVVRDLQPDVVVNCVGLVKQLSDVSDPLVALPINSLFPHKLARLCAEFDSRVIHMSTDCVFSGSKGMYVEHDSADARDLYGLSKLIGEVDYPNAVTLRTSIIGHELNSNRSLVDWFLSQQSDVRGFKRAVFSGLPTAEIARVIADFVIPNLELTGVYHLSAEPISKYDLLTLIAKIYKKNITIDEENYFVIDRSLDSSKFRVASGYSPPSWVALINNMHNFG